jgi:CIC family chloride channel protein
MARKYQIGGRWRSPATRWGRRIGLAVLVGITAGLAAALLDRAIHFGSERLIGQVTPFGTAESFRFDFRVLLLPALGGLAAGVLVFVVAPRSTGHGTDVLTRAFHRHLGAARRARRDRSRRWGPHWDRPSPASFR